MTAGRASSTFDAIFRGEPPPVLLLSGAGVPLAELFAERFKERSDREGKAAEVTRWTAADLDRQPLLMALRSPSFFVAFRIHVLPDAAEIKKGPREDLFEYLRSPDPGVAVILPCAKWAAMKPFQAVPGVRTFSPDEDQASRVLGEYAAAAARKAGKELPVDAGAFLARWLGLDVAAVRSETGKLVAYAGSRTEIGVEDIRRVCVARGEADPFRFAEELLRGNAVQCLTLFRDFARSAATDDYHRLIGAVGWQARRRAAGGRGGGIPPARILAALARLDRRMKGESGLSPEQLWEIELLGLLKGRRGAALP